jgi:hemerythrin
MALFDWKETYSVGVKEIDNQHKMLVGTLNELFEAMRNTRGPRSHMRHY